MNEIPENCMAMLDGVRALMGTENVDNLLEDFQEKLSDIIKERGLVPPPIIVGALLCGFCLGMNNIMNPKSNFNQKFKRSPAYPGGPGK